MAGRLRMVCGASAPLIRVGLPYSVRSGSSMMAEREQAWDAYEAAERRYLQALIDEAPKDTLIGAAEEAQTMAAALREAAFRDIRAAERNSDDAAWSNAAWECDAAEIREVLWERILAAHRGSLVLPEP